MSTYEGLARPAGAHNRCRCTEPAALVRDGRAWCVACHVADLQTPRAPAPEPRPAWHHVDRRVVRHRPSRTHLREDA